MEEVLTYRKIPYGCVKRPETTDTKKTVILQNRYMCMPNLKMTISKWKNTIKKCKKTISQKTRTCVQIIILKLEGEKVEMCKKTKFQETRTCVHIYARTV